VEAVQEFTANIMTTRAEFGGMGTITTATKSGANDFHGGVFWYVRNSALDARNFFAVAKPFQNLHSYGGTIGGPIHKDKTFFFADFDGTRGTAAVLFNASVPTLAMRNGDFGTTALKNPYTNVNPFNGNTILPQFISSQALQVQNLFFPLPNFGPPTQTAGNYRAFANGPEVHRTEEIRLDHNFNSRHSAFLRYANRKDDYDVPGARSPLPLTSFGPSNNTRRVNFWTLGDVASLRPSMVNEFRVGVVVLVSGSSANFDGQAVLSQTGIQGLPDRGLIHNLPIFSIAGLSGDTINLLNPVNDGHAQLADNLSWVHGRHSMKFGVEEINWFVNRYLPNTSGNPVFGNFSFTASKFTGSAYADFLLGLPATVTQINPFPAQYDRFRDWAGYAQDDFKVSPRLTLIYGLRWEYNGPAFALNDNLYSFDLNSGKIVVPNQNSLRYISPYFTTALPVETADQIGLGRSLRNGDHNNFAPRFGFSYQLGNDGKTVIRGGWGVYYTHYSANVPVGLASGPFSANLVSTNNIVNGQPLFTLANPYTAAGTPGTLALRAVNPNLKNSYTHQYTLSVERELTRNMKLRVSYIGSKGTQLAYRRDVNQPLASTVAFANARRPYPLFSAINYADNGANMLYSGMQTQVERRLSKGLMFTSTWIWAKEISDTDDTDDFELNNTIEDTYSRSRDRGNVYSVPRHQWMNQALYELPFGKGKLLSGWQLNTLLNLSTGNWFTPVIAGPDPTNTNTTTLRPDLIASSISYPRSINGWFDPSAFATPANGTWGNAGRGIIQGPGYVLLNLGLQKSVRLEKFGTVELVASFTNVLNHTNLGEPSGGGSPLPGQVTVNNANGGKITATHIFPPAGGARTGQLGLRWSF
jgi:hypothetical protein